MPIHSSSDLVVFYDNCDLHWAPFPLNIWSLFSAHIPVVKILEPLFPARYVTVPGYPMGTKFNMSKLELILFQFPRNLTLFHISFIS